MQSQRGPQARCTVLFPSSPSRGTTSMAKQDKRCLYLYQWMNTTKQAPSPFKKKQPSHKWQTTMLPQTAKFSWKINAISCNSIWCLAGSGKLPYTLPAFSRAYWINRKPSLSMLYGKFKKLSPLPLDNFKQTNFRRVSLSVECAQAKPTQQYSKHLSELSVRRPATSYVCKKKRWSLESKASRLHIETRYGLKQELE